MSLRINHEKLLEKYRTNCTKIEHLLNYLKIKIKKNIKFNTLPVYHDRYKFIRRWCSM